MGVGENLQKAVSLALPPESPNSFCWLWRADRPAEFLNSAKLGSWHIIQEVMSVLASKLGTADAVRQGEERAGFYHPFCEKRAVYTGFHHWRIKPLLLDAVCPRFLILFPSVKRSSRVITALGDVERQI